MKIDAFLAGCLVHKGKDVGIFSVQNQIGSYSFHVLLGSNWFEYNETPEWPPIGLAGCQYPGDDDFLIVGISAEGHTWDLHPSAQTEHMGKIDENHTEITSISACKDAIWACGMGRLALRRNSDGSWTDFSAPKPAISEGVIGFTDIASWDDGSLISVGWGGEIWIRNTIGSWAREDSPTNSNFNAVSISEDGTAVIVGDTGGLVVGKPQNWVALETSQDHHLQGVCQFGGEVFVCSDFEIFRLIDDQLVHETRFANTQRPNTCMNLMAGQSSVICQGERDIWRFEHGQWSAID